MSCYVPYDTDDEYDYSYVPLNPVLFNILKIMKGPFQTKEKEIFIEIMFNNYLKGRFDYDASSNFNFPTYFKEVLNYGEKLTSETITKYINKFKDLRTKRIPKPMECDQIIKILEEYKTAIVI